MTATTVANKMLRYKKPALILFIVWTLAGLSFGGIFALVGNTRNEAFVTVFASNLARYYAWGAISPLIYVFARRFDVISSGSRFRNIVLNVLFGAVISISYALVFILVGRLSEAGFYSDYPSTWSAIQQQAPISTVLTVISFYLPTVLTVHAILFFQNYVSEESKNAELRAELSKAQLAALKMQLHPHFLFNSLHAISSLILIEPVRANRMVALLGDFLRETLDHSDEQVVPLEEELRFLKCYLEIEETRFEDRLTVDFSIDEGTLGVSVPHLILQPIVENAVKHGIAPFASKGRIAIDAKKMGGEIQIRITNSGSNGNKVTMSDVRSDKGVGIANVRLRLGYVYGAKASLKISEPPTGGCQVDINIPILTDLIAD